MNSVLQSVGSREGALDFRAIDSEALTKQRMLHKGYVGLRPKVYDGMLESRGFEVDVDASETTSGARNSDIICDGTNDKTF